MTVDIDLNSILFNLSITNTGVYALNADHSTVTQMDHYDVSYDPTTTASKYSSTCVSPITLIATYVDDNDIDNMDCEGHEIARMLALFVRPKILDYDTKRISEEIEYIFHHYGYRHDDTDGIEEIPDEPFTIILDASVSNTKYNHLKIDLFHMMITALGRFMHQNCNVDDEMILYLYDDDIIQAMSSSAVSEQEETLYV